MRRFHLFGPDHLVGLLCVAAMGYLVQRVGRWATRAMEIILASWICTYIVHAYQVRWGSLTWDTALPLHLCDLLLILALRMLYCPPQTQDGQHRGFELLYFGACGGSIWALITPDIEVGFPHWRFIEFFFGHGLIFWVLAHFYANRSCRILPGSWWRAWKWLLGYTLVVGAIDFIFGWNYGYLRHKPAAGSPLDHMGPWPVYVILGLLASAFLYRGWEWLMIRATSSRSLSS